MESEESFKLAGLWAWSPFQEGKVNLSWFKSSNDSNQFSSSGDVADALEEFNNFLLLTFGNVWKRCTLDLQESLRSDSTLRTTDGCYIKYKLEQVLSLFGARMRLASVVVAQESASYWSMELHEALQDIPSMLTLEEQHKWRVLVGKQASSKSKQSVAVPQKPVIVQPKPAVSSGGMKKEICLNYLRNALSVVNPTTGVVPPLCVKVDCERAHNEVFGKSKVAVVAAVLAAKGDKGLVDAVQADGRFK
jgi:hypothetical protein